MAGWIFDGQIKTVIDFLLFFKKKTICQCWKGIILRVAAE